MPLPKRREDEEPTDWGKALKTVSSWGPPAMETGAQEFGDDAPPPDMVDAGPPPSSLASLTQHLSGLDVGPQETAADTPPDRVDPPPAPARPSVKDLLAPFARMPSAGPAGPDSELEGARQSSDDAFLRAQRGRAGSDFIAAFGGYKPDNSFWDAEEAHGKQGVADLEKKRAMLRQGKQDSRQERLDEAASQLQQLEMAKRTKALQPGQNAALAKLFGVAPEVLDGMTPEGRKEFLDAWKSNNTVQAAKLAKEAEREYQLGRDETSRKYHHEEGLIRDASHERAMANAAGAKAAEATVPGLEAAPGASPTAEDAKKVKATLDAANRLKPMVAQLRELHAKHGATMTGEAAQTMDSITTAIKLEAKTIAELGALSGPDMALMNQLAGMDPTSMMTKLKSTFGVDTTQQALQQLDKWVDTQVAAKKKTYGYQDKPAAPAKPAGGGKGHGKVVKETKSIRQYEDGFLEEK